MTLTPATIKEKFPARITLDKYGIYLLAYTREILKSTPVAFEKIKGNWYLVFNADGFRPNTNGFISSRKLAAIMMKDLGVSAKTRFILEEQPGKIGTYKLNPQQK